jgi:hypothetical protein
MARPEASAKKVASDHAHKMTLLHGPKFLWAAVDVGDMTGAVYGIGANGVAAIAAARARARDWASTYDVRRITPAAAAWVDVHGGQPARELVRVRVALFGDDVIMLASEEDEEVSP